MSKPASLLGGTCLSIVCAIAIALLAAPAQADLRVAKPRTDTVVTGKRAKVVVRGGSRGFRALLDDRNVTKRFRAKNGAMVATFRRGKELTKGSNRLSVSARVNGTRRYAVRTLVRGKRKRGALTVQRSRTQRPALALRVRGPRGKPFEAVELRVNGKRSQSEDWVVGRRVEAGAWPDGRSRFEARLGADEGLRHGKNRVRIRAWRADGTYDERTVRVRVGVRRPLAAAGAGGRVRAGEHIRLDGRATRAGKRGRVAYRWRVVRSPKGAKPRIRGSRRARPKFKADVPGRYRLRLVAVKKRAGAAQAPGAGRSVSTDETTVYVTPPYGPVGTPVTTFAEGGGIEVGDMTFPPNADWLQVTVFDRGSLEVVANEGFGDSIVGPDDIENAIGYIESLDSSNLVVLSGGGRAVGFTGDYTDILTGLENLLEAAGAPIDGAGTWMNQWTAVAEAGEWSAIGVPGVDGSGTVNVYGLEVGDGSPAGALEGYLQLDNNNKYTFVAGDYVPVDTVNALPGSEKNRIRVGGDVYDSDALDPDENGFQVLVLDSLLNPIANKTFVTNDGSGEREGVDQMQEFLAAETDLDYGAPGKLVIIQSIGKPLGYGVSWVGDGALQDASFGTHLNRQVMRDPSVWYSDVTGESLASAIGQLGGAAAHDQIAQMLAPAAGNPSPSAEGGYTLVASSGQIAFGDNGLEEIVAPGPDTRNTATSHAGSTGVHGVLIRDPQATWALSSANWANFDDEAIQLLAFQNPVEWPLAQTKEQQAANSYLAQEMGFTYTDDIRTNYYEDFDADWNSYADQLMEIPYPGEQAGFSEDTFNALKQQLNSEMLDVAEVGTLIHTYQTIFASSGTSGLADLQSIGNAIKTKISTLESSDSATASLESILGAALWVGASIAEVSGEEEFAGAAAVGASIFDFLSTVSTDDDGGRMTAPVTAEVGKLASEVSTDSTNLQAGMGRLGEILVSDYAKLTTAAANTKGAWRTSQSEINALVDALSRTGETEFWTALLAVDYVTYVLDLDYLNSVSDFPAASDPAGITCFDREDYTLDVWGDYTDNKAAWVQRPVGFGKDGTNPTATIDYFGLTLPVEYQSGTNSIDERAESADQDWMAPLFQSASEADGLGADPLAFFADPRIESVWGYCVQEG